MLEELNDYDTCIDKFETDVSYLKEFKVVAVKDNVLMLVILLYTICDDNFIPVKLDISKYLELSWMISLHWKNTTCLY